MNIASSYFLLYHGEQVENLYCTQLKKIQSNEEFIQISALILCSSRKAYLVYGSLESFEELISKVSSFIPNNTHELNILQFSLIEKIEANLTKENLKILLDTFKYLKEQEILRDENYEKLISLFDISKLEDTKQEDVDVDDQMFLNKKEQIEDFINQLKAICEDEISVNLLEDTLKYLKEQKFSIGVTGVMNSGKSSLLNVFLGKEVLGTSVVPETANLSVMKYSKQNYAKVYYWNKKEWEDIKNSSKEIESIANFVKDVEENFKDLDKFIQEQNRFDTIELEKLSEFTSAKSSSKISNIVKNVELGVDLKFLDESIEIVDTPGLDDPVVQREEITKEYISKCDMMLHLMNVSQSGTQKDMEFILDALVYQNVTKLLIVITKADTVEYEELHEVIDYIKKSIRVRFQEFSNSKLENILQNLMIIPISSKMAMLHKIGKADEAIEQGYKLEDTGILDVENFLIDTLFGKDNQKGKLIISSSLQKLKKVIGIEKNSLEYILVHLNKSTDELESELEEFKKKKARGEQEHLLMESDIKYYKQNLKEYIELLETFLNGELESLNNIVIQRIMDDVKYSIKNTKTKPEDERIKTIIYTAIKDGVIDIIRDYRYRFVKKSEAIFDQCKQKYVEFGLELDEQNNHFDAVSFFGDDFISGFLTSNNDILINKVLQEIKVSKTSKLQELEIKIVDIISEQSISLQEKLKDKANKLSLKLLESFFDILNIPLNESKQKLQSEQKTLENMIETSKQSSENKDSLSLNIHQKLKKLETLNKRCEI